MIICNGSPKTGTHLLLKTVFMFGDEFKLALHRHTPFENYETDKKYINIFRSPRNVIGSWLKFTGQEVTEDNYIKEILPRTFEMWQYTEWWKCKDKNVMNVKYEELLTDTKVLNDIAKFLNKPKKQDHFKNIWGGTPTYTGSPFLWRDIWTDRLENVWKANSGIELENALGYDPHKVWIRKKTS